MLNMFFGASPSGKAAVFGAAIRRFDPFRPSQKIKGPSLTWSFFISIATLFNNYT
jgi:hypothetical protein